MKGLSRMDVWGDPDARQLHPRRRRRGRDPYVFGPDWLPGCGPACDCGGPGTGVCGTRLAYGRGDQLAALEAEAAGGWVDRAPTPEHPAAALGALELEAGGETYLPEGVGPRRLTGGQWLRGLFRLWPVVLGTLLGGLAGVAVYIALVWVRWPILESRPRGRWPPPTGRHPGRVRGAPCSRAPGAGAPRLPGGYRG